VIIEGVPNLLKLFQQALQNTAFDRIRRDEIEDQAIEKLAVAVDTTHALFQPIGVPRDIIVKEDVAALQVDAFAGGFRGNKNLNPPIFELLLRIEPAVWFLPRARFHATMNEADTKAPVFQDLH